MRTVTNSKSIKAACAILVLLVLVPLVSAYPPNNAAVLYYRSCLCYKADSAMQKVLSDLVEGKIEVDDSIAKYVGSNRSAIKFTITAADVLNCDWGLDYSEGMLLLLPHLSSIRNLARLVLADGKVAAAQGDYELALDRCLSVHKMSGHIGDDVLVSYLVAIASNKMANKCIVDILSDMPADLEMLSWFKNQLANVSSRIPSAKAAVNGDARIALVEMRVERAKEILALFPLEDTTPGLEKIVPERLRNADEEFFGKNRDYFKNYMSALGAILETPMPYAQTYEELKKLGDKVGKDAVKDAGATMTALMAPAIWHVYTAEIKYKNFFNAIKAAIDIYIIKAKTGRLPDALPAGLPKDLFSGKDFEYERKDDGFVLRCQGKDLDKDKIHQYEFKVPK